jgi:hypothetical protein
VLHRQAVRWRLVQSCVTPTFSTLCAPYTYGLGVGRYRLVRRKIVEALYSAGVPSYLLSNTAARTMYQTSPDVGEQRYVEAGTQEQEGAEEEQEMSTLYETPVHTTMPPQTATQKAEERVPAKSSPSMLPRPVHTTAVPVGHPTTKASGIPPMSVKHETAKASGISAPKTVVTKHESGKPSSSEMGHGSCGITEYICDDRRFPGKPLRILRLY